MTLRDKIKEVTKKHLQRGNSLFGQCLSAVGWVGNTIDPSSPNLVELSMADVAGGGFVVGASLFSRPIYVVRYQGFQWYNAITVCNYAAKSKAIWGRSCPIFIRSIAMEGAIGPVAGSSHHSIACRQPGIKVVSPMTPGEYEDVYCAFMGDDDPYYISEHRLSYTQSEETPALECSNPDWVVFPFSITRFAALEAAQRLQPDVNVTVYPQVWIKPTKFSENQILMLSESKYGGIVLDDDYASGVASSIAHELMMLTNKKVHILALKDITAGFARRLDNLPPTADEIIDFIKKMTS